MRLQGKTIIIAGASAGIGRASALLFAAEGANLVLGARRREELAAVAEEVRAAGGKAVCLPGDARDEACCEALVDLAETEFGGLDAGFNNAGMLGDLGPVPDMTLDNWEAVVRSNLTSAFLAAKYQLPALQRRGGGALVFTSSFVGFESGLPGMAAYGAAKTGLVGLVRCLAAEHGPEGIRVNALLPGGTETDMAKEFASDPDSIAFVRSLHALKRMAGPEEIARAALFLVSSDSSFVTGTALLADGGNSINKA